MTTTAAATRYDLDREALGGLLHGQPRYRVDQVWTGLYEQLASPAELTNLPKGLRAELEERLPLALDARHGVHQRPRRHRQVPVGAARRHAASSRC